MIINLTINGATKTMHAVVGDLLLDVLRKAGYQSVKKGCGEGDCGACVVLLDGKPVNSCMILACSVEGKNITTVEGLGSIDKPHPLQTAFVDAGAVQCGFCTPGMILSAKALLDEKPNPSETEIKKALDGNLCRCTGYVKILDAVQNAVRAVR